MDAPKIFSRVVDGLKYDVATATMIAHNCYWDGSNFERHGRNTYLYRTPNGRFFTVNLTMWQGERDTLTPVTESEARDLYEGALSEHVESYDDVFGPAQAA